MRLHNYYTIKNQLSKGWINEVIIILLNLPRRTHNNKALLHDNGHCSKDLQVFPQRRRQRRLMMLIVDSNISSRRLLWS